MQIVKNIINTLESKVPISLKEDFDNVGLMVGDKEKSVSKVLLALDCTLEVIEEAKEKGIDLIITHHPLIFRKPNSITSDTLQGRKIIELIKNDIALYSSHTNLDSVEGGLNETIVGLLGYDESTILQLNKNINFKNAGLGRIVQLNNEVELQDVILNIKDKLNVEAIRVVKGRNTVRTIAIINGSGQDFFAKAVNKGADCIITGDTTYHFASDYKEMGVSIIDIGHFASEWITFQKVMKKLLSSIDGIDILISDTIRDPYITMKF